MQSIRVDLHCHSHYAGGASQKSLLQVSEMQKTKGLHIVGTGDCLQPNWLHYLENQLIPQDGLLALRESQINTSDNFVPLFCLQTEIVITAPAIAVDGGRLVFHLLMIFPSFDVVHKAQALMQTKWLVKSNIGRPFLACDDRRSILEFLNDIKSIDTTIGLIFAHPLAHNGILGSRNGICYLDEIIANAVQYIDAIETGISATPNMLATIPDLAQYTLVSFSDSHSHHAHRLGREYTVLEVENLSYKELFKSTRDGRILYTFETSPAGGRYYLTGHAKSRHKTPHACMFGPRNIPRGRICPICGNRFDMGVLERSQELSRMQGGTGQIVPSSKPRNFVEGINLAEVLSAISETGPTTKKTLSLYYGLCSKIGSEASFWETSSSNLSLLLSQDYPSSFVETLMEVRNGNFAFDMPGGDGEYGELRIGMKIDYDNYRSVPRQFDVEQLDLL